MPRNTQFAYVHFGVKTQAVNGKNIVHSNVGFDGT